MAESVLVGEGSYHVLLNAVAATGSGSAKHPFAKDKSFQAILTGTATVIVEGSNDPRVITDPTNAVWVGIRDTGSTAAGPPAISFTASGGQSNDEPWRHVRARVTAFTDGTISIFLGT